MPNRILFSFATVLRGLPASAQLRRRIEAADRHVELAWGRRGDQRREFDPTWIYFVVAPSMSLIKIGSSLAPDRRLAEFRGYSPVPLDLVGSMEGSTIGERALHRAFGDVRSHAEWFRASSDLNELITLVGLQHRDAPQRIKAVY